MTGVGRGTPAFRREATEKIMCWTAAGVSTDAVALSQDCRIGGQKEPRPAEARGTYCRRYETFSSR